MKTSINVSIENAKENVRKLRKLWNFYDACQMEELRWAFCGSTDLDKLSLPTTLQSKEEGSLPLGSILHVAAVYLDTRLHQTSIPWRSYLSHVRHRGVFSIFVTVSSILSNISHLLLLILCSNPPPFTHP